MKIVGGKFSCARIASGSGSLIGRNCREGIVWWVWREKVKMEGCVVTLVSNSPIPILSMFARSLYNTHPTSTTITNPDFGVSSPTAHSTPSPSTPHRHPPVYSSTLVTTLPKYAQKGSKDRLAMFDGWGAVWGTYHHSIHTRLEKRKHQPRLPLKRPQGI